MKTHLFPNVLVISDLNALVKEPENKTVSEGESAFLECQAGLFDGVEPIIVWHARKTGKIHTGETFL